MGYLLNPDFLLLAKIPGAMKPINQENGTCDDRPTALVTHNNCTSALDSGITGQKKKSILAVRFCHYSPHQVAIYN